MAESQTFDVRFSDGTSISLFNAEQGERVDNATGVESFELTDDFTDPLGSFKFRVHVAPHSYEALTEAGRLRKGEVVALQVAGRPVSTPLITSIRTTLSKEDGLGLDVECKSVLVTPYEGSVDPRISQHVKADTAVGDVVLRARGKGSERETDQQGSQQPC